MAVKFYNIELNANCLEVPEFRTNAIFDYEFTKIPRNSVERL